MARTAELEQGCGSRRCTASSVLRRAWQTGLIIRLRNNGVYDLCILIENTPALDWLLLTKRPENFPKLAPQWRTRCPDNVWFGISAEDQQRYDQRWERLRQIDAAVRFVSYEPAIGPLRLRSGIGLPDWIICGGETGTGARMMRHVWARKLRDECADKGVSFFLKQYD